LARPAFLVSRGKKWRKWQASTIQPSIKTAQIHAHLSRVATTKSISSTTEKNQGIIRGYLFCEAFERLVVPNSIVFDRPGQYSSMRYKYQTHDRNCFVTCFRNAMEHFSIPSTPPLERWLAIFDNGMESCTISAAQVGLVKYGRSLRRFNAEWQRAQLYQMQDRKRIAEPMEWAQYLLGQGIELIIRNGPIEQKDLILCSVKEKKLAICDIAVPASNNPTIACKHAILIISNDGQYLYAHDPLEDNKNHEYDTSKVRYLQHEDGANLRLDCAWFFSLNEEMMKPKPNPTFSDCEYSFVLVGKTEN
jgi:hypothetical protein